MESSKTNNISSSNSKYNNKNNKYESKNKIKNLVEYYLKYNKVPLIQDKFEFKCKSDVLEETNRSKDKTNRDIGDSYEFKYRIEEIDLDGSKRLRIIRNIRDIKEEELEIWIKDFEKICTHKKWDVISKQRIGLGEVIVDPNLENIFSLADFEAIKKELRKHVVKKTSSYVIQMKLSKCVQENFVYIRDYISELKQLIDKYSKMEALTKPEYNRKLRETFFIGLGFNTRMKIVEIGKNSLDEMIQYIENIEETLVLEADKKGFRVEEDYDGTRQEKYINSKWCTLHRNDSHNSKDCYVLKNSTPEELKVREEEYKKKNKKNPDKVFIMKELEFEKLDLELKGQVFNRDVKIMLDTGACRNFINNRIVKELGLSIREDKPIKVLTANNQEVAVRSVVDTTLKLDGLTKEFNVTLYVLEDCTVEVILGNTFIFGNEIILDFKNNVLRIGQDSVKILEENSKLNEEHYLDRMFFESLGLLKFEEEEANELNDLVYLYKKENQKFNEFKIEPIKIRTNKEEITNIKPIIYSVPNKYKKQGLRELKRLIDEDIIEEVNAEVYSPAFFIEKRNKDLRLVIDYRMLNENIIDEPFDIPKIFENLQLIGKNKYFTQIDLKNGFNQIPIEKSSQKLTAFKMMNKTYQYKRVPFGIRSGPKIFQKTITKILEGLENCFVYIDDIVIYGKTKEKHDDAVKEVLKRLYEHEVKINFEKTSFYKTEIKILGFFINEQGIIADTTYLNNKIFDMEPKTKKQLQKIIGIFNWYRRFIKNMSEKLYKITELLKEDKFKWTIEHQNIVNEMREEITRNTNLKFPDFKKKFIIETDASKIGIGAVLYQEDGIVGYFSKKLNSTEQNYSVVEKELYGIIKSLMFFKEIIQGYYVEIYTDNTNCVLENQKFTSRMERWKVLLNDYNFQIRGIKGIDNNIADTLSRCYTFKSDQKRRQQYEEKIGEFLEPAAESGKKREVKQGMETKFLRYVHKQSEHSGIVICYYNIKNYVDIRNLGKKLSKIIGKCKKCIENKNKNSSRIEKCRMLANEPFERVSSDIYGPFDLTNFEHQENGEKGYFITMTDIKTRISYMRFTTNINVKQIIKTYRKWFKKYGKPKIIITDNGKQYRSEKLKIFLEREDVEARFVPAYTPSSNGISERINQSISEVLRMNKGKNIERIRKRIIHKLNENYNTSIGCSPKAAVTGINFYNPKREIEDIIIKETLTGREDEFPGIEIGRFVYKRNFSPDKLEERYTGPYEILERGKNKRWYKLEDEEWYHIKNLKF